MRKVFAGLAVVLLLVVVAQFFFAATGAFSTAPNDESYRPHHALGYVIFLVPLVMTVVAALARMPGRLIGMPALVAGLTSVQVLIAVLARAFGDEGDSNALGQLIFGLHAVNGLAILAVAGMIVRQARALPSSAAPLGGPGLATTLRRPDR
jgi:FtsH-binding integral membrane protein